MSEIKTTSKSGRFLLEDTAIEDVFVPEHFDDEEKMFGDTAERFVADKVIPRMEELDQKGPEIIPDLLRQVGELGVFLADVPEEWDGLGASKRACMRVAEKIGAGGAFGVAALVQSGIGGLPIIFFGTEDQRERYLPGITSGEIITAYALTEPGSGSDALSAKTTARFVESEGVYVLDGTKQFITNAAFADLFITFAKVDGKYFTGFIVDRNTDGVSLGAEEIKMGLKGSSTRSLILEGVRVPKENMMGQVGKGHRIAFNVLNIGRLKLAPAVLGGAKRTLGIGARYARERKQFGRSLSEFGLIQQKLAGSAVRIYCSESMCYRSAAMIDDHIAAVKEAEGKTTAEATVAALRELNVECSINKVYGSEMLDWVVDEMLQLHGGYGYIQEYPVERAYRDSRINRIWEGTSEINRMLITGSLLQRAMKNQIPILPAVKQITDELMSRMGRPDPGDGMLAAEGMAIANAKKMTLFASGVAAQKHLANINEEQEILSWLADMIIQTFAMESARLRTVKVAGERGAEEMAARGAAVRLAVEHGMSVVETHARWVLAASHTGEELRSSLSMIKKLMRREPFDLVTAGRTVAAFVMEREGYPFT